MWHKKAEFLPEMAPQNEVTRGSLKRLLLKADWIGPLLATTEMNEKVAVLDEESLQI